MRKTIGIITCLCLALLLCAGVAAITYTHSADYKAQSFSDGIQINGLDCSGMTYGEAEAALTEYWNGQKMVVVGNLEEKLTEYTDFGCTYDIADNIKSIKRSNLVRSALNHYLHIPYSVQMAMNVEKTSGKFKKEVKHSEFLTHGDPIETKDAYVAMANPDYPIVPEVYGNKADVDAYYDGIVKGIELGELRFKFDAKDYIDAPEVKSDDPKLLNYQRCCRKYLTQKITYDLGKETFTVTADDIRGMLKSVESGEPDREAVAKYVKKMANEYDTFGDSVKFKSLTGKTFNVRNVTYGWSIDKDKETAQLMEDISSHKDVKREPEFATRGNGTYSTLVGDTYIDIDITNQHLVYFENTNRRFETDVVTGCVAAGHSTPTGIFKVLNKGRNLTLKGGSKKKKTYYESFVSYWMGFYGSSYGMHDATWRSSFGGTIYKYSGSHGCVNIPPSNMPSLYNMVSVGTPVIVHY